MSGDFNDKVDKVSGKTKETVGEATDDERLADEGRAQQSEAEAKEAVKKAGDHLGNAAEKIRDVFRKK